VKNPELIAAEIWWQTLGFLGSSVARLGCLTGKVSLLDVSRNPAFI
jgi:hypothetical protein